jgi:hypothetical protein
MFYLFDLFSKEFELSSRTWVILSFVTFHTINQWIVHSLITKAFLHIGVVKIIQWCDLYSYLTNKLFSPFQVSCFQGRTVEFTNCKLENTNGYLYDNLRQQPAAIRSYARKRKK